MLLYQILECTTPGKIFKKKSYKNSKCNILATTWNDKSELPNRSYSDQIFKIVLSISKKTWRKD